MVEWIRGVVLRLMRVQTDPALPAGSGDVRVFRAAPSYFKYRVALWAIAQLGALAGLIAVGIFVLSNLGNSMPAFAVWAIRGVEALAWIGFLAQLPFSFFLVRLDFELRWYVLADRSLRIREGIVTLKEKTMTYANIQQIEIRQNPLQRLLGIADVQVRSAGGGGGSRSGGSGSGTGESMHESWFRGVADAAGIRELIRERVRRHRDSGLGDPDEPPPVLPTPAPSDVDAVDAAHDLLAEVRALREELAAHPR